MREFKITDARDGQSRTIRHFQITDFFDENVDHMSEEKVSLIIDFISVIQQTREQFGIQRNPVIVQSEDGSKRVCLFAVITHALERARFEGVVDIPEQIRLCKIMRPGCVMSFDEYKYIYKVMMVFISCYKNSWQSLEDVRSGVGEGFIGGQINPRYLNSNHVTTNSDRTATVSGDTDNTNHTNNTNGSNHTNTVQDFAGFNAGTLQRGRGNIDEPTSRDNRTKSSVYDVPVPSAYN